MCCCHIRLLILKFDSRKIPKTDFGRSDAGIVSKVIKWLIYIPFIFIGVLILLLIVSPFINDRTATGIEKHLISLPLPPSTQLKEGFSASRKLVGNGNGVQFLGAILIETELSQEELEAHYAQYQEKAFDDYIIEPQTSAELTMIEHGSRNSFLNWQAPVPPKQAYIIYTWGSGNTVFREFDLRGH